MPVLIGLAMLFMFAVAYSFAHAHPMALAGVLVITAAIFAITLTFVRGLSRRQVMTVTRPAPRALPPRRQMPEPVEPVPDWRPEPFTVAAGSPAPGSPDETEDSPAAADALDICERHGCDHVLDEDAWELEVGDHDSDGHPVTCVIRLCSDDCAQQWQAEDTDRRAAL